MNQFEKIIEIMPAFDKRAEGYGIGSSSLRMILRDTETKQAVQFAMYLGWYLPGSLPESSPLTRKVHRGFRSVAAESSDPMPFDLGYHAIAPRYEGQMLMDENCEVTGGVCYYDGSSLNAYDAWQILVADGHEGLWRFLEDYYRETFAPTPEPA